MKGPRATEYNGPEDHTDNIHDSFPYLQERAASDLQPSAPDAQTEQQLRWSDL